MLIDILYLRMFYSSFNTIHTHVIEPDYRYLRRIDKHWYEGKIPECEMPRLDDQHPTYVKFLR